MPTTASELVLKLVARVQNSEDLKKLGSNLDSLADKTSKLDKASRLLGAGAIVAFGAASVKAFADAEQQTMRLQLAYQRFPAINDRSLQSMLKLNDAIQSSTGFDNDALAAAEAKLAMYKLNGQQIQSLIPLVTDYARAQNIDVVEAATNIGRAFIGNSRALKAIGIDFKATGDTARDVATVMDALSGTVGGTADAFGQTTAGQLQIAQQEFQDMQEEIGAALVPALKLAVDAIRTFSGTVKGLPEPVRGALVAAGALAATFLLLAPRIKATVDAMQLMFPAATKAAAGLEAETAAAGSSAAANSAAGAAASGFGAKLGAIGRAGGPIAIGVTATLALTAAFKQLLAVTPAGAKSAEEYQAALESGNASTIEAALNSAKAAQEFDGVGGKLRLLGTAAMSPATALPMLAGSMQNASEATANFDSALSQMVSAGHADQAAKYVGYLGLSADEVKAKFPQYAAAVDAAGKSTGAFGDATSDATDKSWTFSDAVKALDENLKNLRGEYQNQVEAQAAVEAAFDAAAKSVQDHGRTLDANTVNGRANLKALGDITDAAFSNATAMAKAGRSTEDIAAATQHSRDEFVYAARQMGLGADAAEELANKYGLIPRNVKTAVVASGITNANQQLDAFLARLGNIPDQRRVLITEVFQTDESLRGRAQDYQRNGRAGGGVIRGAGSGTSDSIPARLSNGEYVIKASTVSSLGVGFLNDLNDDGVVQGFASGGSPLDANWNDSLGSTARGRRSSSRSRSSRSSSRVGSNPTANAALSNLNNAVDNLDKQNQKLADLIKGRSEMVTSVGGQASGYASLSNAFDVNALPRALEARAAATQKVVDAERALFDARRQLNLAGTPEERAKAAQAEATAQANLASARQGVAAAERQVAAAKPTLANIRAGLQARLAGLRKFRQLVKKMHDMGFAEGLVKQVIDMGPEDGTTFAEALTSGDQGNVYEFNKLHSGIDWEGRQVGGVAAGYQFDSLIAGQRGVVDRARARATQYEQQVVESRVYLDGKQIATALANYRKAMGGRPLGLG